MSDTVTDSIKEINEMLGMGPEYCAAKISRFSSLVDELSAHSSRLSPNQYHFLNCLIEFKKEMGVNVVFISSVKKALSLNYKSTSHVLKQIEHVEERISIYATTLSDIMEAKEYVEECMRIHERNPSNYDWLSYGVLEDHFGALKYDIQFGIVNILKARETLKKYYAELSELSNERSMLGQKAVIAENVRKTIENLKYLSLQ
ncbi:hypothetical protein QL285_027367 [Trifolium repens]|nr:hypothetical protein QL285_027367 [Trifolium repens]